MKKLISTLFILTTIVSYSSEFRNGTYRGVFVSGQETQVEVQFNLKNDIISKPKYRTLFYKGEDYLKSEKYKDQKEKYEATLDYTNGKNIKEALELLYTPDLIPRAGASVRATKVRAAMQNAINSGVYKPE